MLHIIFSLLLFLFPPIQEEDKHVVVFLNKTNHKSEGIKAIYEEHVKFISKFGGVIELKGKLESGGEFLIFNSGSIVEVEEVVEKSPGVFKGIYRPEYFKTNLRFGDFCEGANTSFERHNFVRYTSHITKYNVQHVPQLLKAHDDYIKQILKTGNVLAEGVFDNSDGGFMIIKGNLSTEVITNDPTVSAGFTIPEINDIWINKGFFCNEYQGN